MTTRKTFSLGDELADAFAREAVRQGKPESALAREAFEEYLSARKGSKLRGWVGKGRSEEPIDHEALHEELVEILEAEGREQRG